MISLTAIAQPVDELARLNIETVVARLNGESPKPVLLEPTLVAGGSTVPVRPAPA